MFTGLVEGLARVEALRRRGKGAELVLARPTLGPGLPIWRPVRGESLAVNGCCLTVSALGRAGRTGFELSHETLERTCLGGLRSGDQVNLERARRLGDRLGGHLVSGHVEAVGRLVRSEDSGDGGRLVTFEVPSAFRPWLLEKASITVDGVSLTIVAPRARRFSVALIPETLVRTTLGNAGPGRRVHLEADPLGRWVARLFPARVRRRRRARS